MRLQKMALLLLDDLRTAQFEFSVSYVTFGQVLLEKYKQQTVSHVKTRICCCLKLPGPLNRQQGDTCCLTGELQPLLSIESAHIPHLLCNISNIMRTIQVRI